MLTDQWFVAMSKPAPAGTLHPGNRSRSRARSGRQRRRRFVPENWTTTYNQWLENIQDWCISRQLWWGHRIPAWYDERGNVFVARSDEEARAASRRRTPALTRDDGRARHLVLVGAVAVLHARLARRQANAALDLYLPSSVLVTGFDIIFFWVARMVMMTPHFTGKVPFRDVYINGLVRDAEGQKMSQVEGQHARPARPDRRHHLEALVAKRTSGLLTRAGAKVAAKRAQAFPGRHRRLWHRRAALHVRGLASHGRDINSIWRAATATAISATSSGTRRASC